jgi:two-component system, LytTR family, response regulator
MEKSKVQTIKPIALKTANGIEMFDYSEIIYFEASRNVCMASVLGENSQTRVLGNLAYIESMLPEQCFFRCHRSYIINLWHIKRFNEKCRILVMADNSEISVSEDKAPLLKKMLLKI